MQKTKIAATCPVAAIPKADSITIILNYNRIIQKSKAEIHPIGGELV